MKIRLVNIDLTDQKVVLYCSNEEQETDVEFYIHVFFKGKKIDFSIQRLLNCNPEKTAEVFKINEDFIKDTAKKHLQDAVEKYLKHTSTTMFLCVKEDMQKIYVLNKLQEIKTGLKHLLINWCSNKWRVLDISWSIIKYSQDIYFCDIYATVALPKEECDIFIGSDILTNCGWSKVKFVQQHS